MIFRCFLLVSILLSSITTVAQENLTMFFEPDLSLGYKVSSNYSHTFEVENRNFFFRDENFKYQVKHLEFAHISTYSLNEKQSISAGVQYRFEENFNSSEDNEFRLQQSFQWQSDSESFRIKQQIRNEQRFYTNSSTYRLRYELGFQFPLKNSSGKDNYLKTEAESLCEIGKLQKPEYEQRLSTLYGWRLSPKSSFELGLQYRLSDYTQNLAHELFLVTGIDIKF